MVNSIYKEAAVDEPRGYLHCSEKQNVSSDIIGLPKAAALIEAGETHTRTAEVSMDLQKLCSLAGQSLPVGSDYKEQDLARIAITQAVIYGWYDNELGSYVNMLGDRTVSVAGSMGQ